MILLDVNLWLAAVVERHPRFGQASEWFDDQAGDLVLCRVTQMSVLRLLTNPTVMREDVLTRNGAWLVIDRLRQDPRVVWADEPDGVERAWRALSSGSDGDHKLWTDDYLAAFAQAGGMTFATLDRRCAQRYSSVDVAVIA